MPYQHNSDGFERFDGEITLSGKIYKYVKRKYVDGNIIFLCLPDYNKMHLETAKNNYSSNINDFQGSGTNKQNNSKSTIGKNLSNDFEQNLSGYTFDLYISINKPHFSNHVSRLATATLSTPGQPPELACI